MNRGTICRCRSLGLIAIFRDNSGAGTRVDQTRSRAVLLPERRRRRHRATRELGFKISSDRQRREDQRQDLDLYVGQDGTPIPTISSRPT